MKYMNHFMRINILTKENIKNQLFFFSKEALQSTVINSKCGIIKSTSKNDINIFNGFSPLLCVYRRATCKYTLSNWEPEKIKKDISITGNAFMTLGLLELVNYLRSYKGLDEEKYLQSGYFLSLAEKQLDFYSSNLRNEEGIFVDKKDISDEISGKLKFENKDKIFNFADQALLMAAYYNCSTLSHGKISLSYKQFSMDIFSMFKEFKEEIYEAPFNQLPKLCLGLIVFYTYSKNPEVLNLLIDLADYTVENYSSVYLNWTNKALTDPCLCSIIYNLIYKITGYIKYKDLSHEISSKLLSLYDEASGIFIKETAKKDLVYYCDEIILYLHALILSSEEENQMVNIDSAIIDIFKHLVSNSGLIQSWPDVPIQEAPERYINLSRKEEDFLQDNNFRIETIPNPEQSEFPPIFNKSIQYNVKKTKFSPADSTFDTTKNMLIYFMTLFLFKGYN